MKIGINAVVLGSRDTGVGIWTRGLIQALARADDRNEYVLYHRRGINPLRNGAVPSNFQMFDMPGPRSGRVPRIAWEESCLPRVCREHGVDVLHCPAYVAPHRPGVPTVVTLHDLLVYTHPKCCRLLNRLHFRLRLPETIWGARRIHCTSHWTRSKLCARFPLVRARARVIHPGVDDVFRPIPPRDVEQYRSRRGWPRDPFLFVGNPEPKKNLRMLLHAFMLLKHHYQCHRKLMMVGGEGWGSVDIDELVQRLGLGGEVIRTGYVPREELPLIYANAVALVFPSEVEGFGLPPLEAMACGTPVVTTGAGGLSESVGAAALRPQRTDAMALAETMHQMDKRGEIRRKYRRAGLRRAGMFHWDNLVGQFLEIYREAATDGT
jgi:glycosyltransferase involved in cell wall biosynthesis